MAIPKKSVITTIYCLKDLEEKENMHLEKHLERPISKKILMNLDLNYQMKTLKKLLKKLLNLEIRKKK